MSAFRIVLFLSALVCLQPASVEAAKASFFCGYRIVEHDPNFATIGRLATAAAYDSRTLQFYFPTVSSISIPKQGESYLLNLFDGVIRTGAARFSDGVIRPYEVDVPAGSMILDIAVMAPTMRARRGEVPVPITAIADDSGSIRVYFPDSSDAGAQIVKSEMEATQKVSAKEHRSLALPRLRNEKFESVALATHSQSPHDLRIFGLTSEGVYQFDVTTSGDIVTQVSEREWRKVYDVANFRFVRALSSSQFSVADETGNVQMIRRNRLTSTAQVPGGGFLHSYTVFEERGGLRAVTLSTKAGPLGNASTIHIYDGSRFQPLDIDFPEGEIPMAVGAAGLSDVRELAWKNWKSGDSYKTGHLSEILGSSVRRVLILTRNGTDYQMRGLRGFENNNRWSLSSFPWYYVGGEYPHLVKRLLQAGFKLDQLGIDVQVDLGEVGHRISQRLHLEHGFQKWDPKHPEIYRGDASSITAAWINRLDALRDLRLERARVASSIAEEGIDKRRDQLMVYELIHLEEQARLERDALEEATGPLNERQWLDRFQLALSDTSSPLIQSARFQYQQIKKFYELELEKRPWDATDNMGVDEIGAEGARPLFLLSRYYFGRPFKYLVEDFLLFCEERNIASALTDRASPWEPTGARYWTVLADYLDARDPLRKVVNEKALEEFLRGR